MERCPHIPVRLTRSVSQPIEPIQPKFYPFDLVSSHSDGSSCFEVEGFKRAHLRRGSEPLLPFSSMPKSSLSSSFGMQSPAKQCAEQVDGKPTAKQESVLNGVHSHERFPMGTCNSTLPELGWLDLACGPRISIDIIYHGHDNDVSDVNKSDGKMIPNVLKATVDVPKVLFRVYGCIVRDLMGLRVSDFSIPPKFITFVSLLAKICEVFVYIITYIFK